ncbi:hypothetical protein [Modestobacter marinus]|uniref:hypothetical protein n=1 Tax=Modestobacter marinus TaxID=477641 RepID=UPI001C94C1BF|nr:hypothetical protein [Modestobacter marinus]
MMTLACDAVGQAALSAGTASLDDQRPGVLMYVAGWLTTAADLTREAMLMRELESTFDVLL